MTITQRQTGGTVTLALEGRLDTTTSAQVQQALLGVLNEEKSVIIDFTDLAYVSSAGLRVLLLGQKTAKGKGVTLTVSHVSDEIMEVFEITGFADILTII